MLTAADYETLASFRRGVRRFLAFAETNARAAGLTSQQHQALLAIKARENTAVMSIGDLAAELLLKHHSAVELVGRLEKAGFTCRTADVHDRRKIIISLTPAGEEILRGLSVSNLQELRLIAPTLSKLLGQVNKLGAAP